MTVLVVGGAGYIGSHTAHTLRRRGYEVILYDNLSTGFRRLAEGFELIVGDIADQAKLASALARVEAVMHFAAVASVGESVQNPRKYLQNNVVDAITLLNSVVDAGVKRLIFSSSCAVYGTPATVPIGEGTPRVPVNCYGASKLAFENALEAYSRAYDFRYVSLRYFNAAGADEQGCVGEMHHPETHLIPAAFEAITGERPALEIFGTDYPTKDGTCIRDYIHVNDLAEAHVLGLEYLNAGSSIAMNLGTGSGHSVREIIHAVEEVAGQTVPCKLADRRPGDPPALVADPRLAEKALHWRANRSLPQIVSTAWSWHTKTHSAPVTSRTGA